MLGVDDSLGAWATAAPIHSAVVRGNCPVEPQVTCRGIGRNLAKPVFAQALQNRMGRVCFCALAAAE